MRTPLDLENVRIYSKADVVDAIHLIGQDVYMSDDKNFENYYENRLVGVQLIEDEPALPFVVGYDGMGREFYKYFILKKDIKFKEETKIFRPYRSIFEFCDETGCEEIGKDLITIRNKDRKQESVLLYEGYSVDAVHLGGYVLTFETLVKHYEFWNKCDSEWRPLGVEE